MRVYECLCREVLSRLCCCRDQVRALFNLSQCQDRIVSACNTADHGQCHVYEPLHSKAYSVLQAHASTVKQPSALCLSECNSRSNPWGSVLHVQQHDWTGHSFTGVLADKTTFHAHCDRYELQTVLNLLTALSMRERSYLLCRGCTHRSCPQSVARAPCRNACPAARRRERMRVPQLLGRRLCTMVRELFHDRRAAVRRAVAAAWSRSQTLRAHGRSGRRQVVLVSSNDATSQCLESVPAHAMPCSRT